MNLLRILIWTYGSGKVELTEEGITSSGGMVGAGAHGEVDLWRGGGGRGRWRVVKDICPKGNNKVIIYFLIS